MSKRTERISEICDKLKTNLIRTIETTGANKIHRPFLVPAISHGESLLTLASSYLQAIRALNLGIATETKEVDQHTYIYLATEAFVLYLADSTLDTDESEEA